MQTFKTAYSDFEYNENDYAEIRVQSYLESLKKKGEPLPNWLYMRYSLDEMGRWDSKKRWGKDILSIRHPIRMIKNLATRSTVMSPTKPWRQMLVWPVRFLRDFYASGFLLSRMVLYIDNIDNMPQVILGHEMEDHLKTKPGVQPFFR